MTTDCSLNYKFNTWKFLAQNIGRTCCVQKLFLTFRTIFVHNMFSPCCAKRRASDKDLPVLTYTTKIAKPLLWSGVMSLGNRFSPQKGVLIYRTLFINWSWGWRRQKYGYISEHDKEVHITCIFWKESRIWLIFMHVIKRMVKIKPYCPSKKFDLNYQ